MCECVDVCMCACVYMCMCGYVAMWMCGCVYVCMRVCVYVKDAILQILTCIKHVTFDSNVKIGQLSNSNPSLAWEPLCERRAIDAWRDVPFLPDDVKRDNIRQFA